MEKIVKFKMKNQIMNNLNINMGNKIEMLDENDERNS